MAKITVIRKWNVTQTTTVDTDKAEIAESLTDPWSNDDENGVWTNEEEVHSDIVSVRYEMEK